VGGEHDERADALLIEVEGVEDRHVVVGEAPAAAVVGRRLAGATTRTSAGTRLSHAAAIDAVVWSIERVAL
jgi:hypothetical protein